MTICDNGKGINGDIIHKGHHGLDNMKLRAERIGGKLLIENMDRGIKVTLIARNI